MKPPLFSRSLCNIETSPKLLLFSCRSIHGWFYHNFIIISLFQHLELKSRSPIRKSKPWLSIPFQSLSLPFTPSPPLPPFKFFNCGLFIKRYTQKINYILSHKILILLLVRFVWASKEMKWNAGVLNHFFCTVKANLGIISSFLISLMYPYTQTHTQRNTHTHTHTRTHTLVKDIVAAWSMLGLPLFK